MGPMAHLHARGCRAFWEDAAVFEVGDAGGVHAWEMIVVVVHHFLEAVGVGRDKVKGAEALGEVGGLARGEVDEDHVGCVGSGGLDLRTWSENIFIESACKSFVVPSNKAGGWRGWFPDLGCFYTAAGAPVHQ